MTIWVISDLHLSAQRPAVTQAFLHWLQHSLEDANALYILGDFFEVWVGDDGLQDPTLGAAYQPVVDALKAVSERGVAVYLMHGNRDFLLGAAVADACGAQCLPDPTRLTVGAQRILLTHGDALCTDDVAYQQFRAQVRSPAWQQAFLAQPLSARLAFAEQARQQSRANKAMQAAEIMDVNAEAVAQCIRQHDYPQVLLHGHTHRPAIHSLVVDGHPCCRWVLGDWEQTAVVACISTQGITPVTLTLAVDKP